MEQIMSAFRQAGAKKNRTHLLLSALFLYIAVGQLTALMGLPYAGGLAMAVAAGCLGYRIFRERRSGALKKAVSRAFLDPASEDGFYASVEREMNTPSAASWKNEKDRLYLFATDSWLILVTPNGSRICQKRQICGVSRILSNAKNSFRVQLQYTDRDPESFPYPELEKPLCSLLNIPCSE